MMKDKLVILNLLHKFSNDNHNVSWKMECAYCDGLGTTINKIKIIEQPGNRDIGIFTYRVETGMVVYSKYKKMKSNNPVNIVDHLLDMMNYSKDQMIT